MTPNPTPPWRLIEAPDDGASPTGTPTPAPTAPERPAGLDPALMRTAAILAAAVALAVLAFILALTSGSGDGVVIDGSEGNGMLAAEASPGEPTDGAQDAGVVVVEVAGAVSHPGVFRLPTGSRVADVIDAAGGYGPRVDTTRVGRELNLAARVEDGDRVLVASRDDEVTATDAAGVSGGSDGSASAGTDGGLVDLNLATAEALDELPGIGPVTAAKILAAREEAPFVSVDDLRSRGILGEKTFERLRDLVAVP